MLLTIGDPNFEYRNAYDLIVDVDYNGKTYTGLIKDDFETME